MSIIGDAMVRVRPDTSTFTSKVKGALMTAGKIAAGAFAAKGVFDFFKGAVEGAVKSEESMKRLDSVVRNLGQGNTAAAGQTQKFLGDLSNLSSFGRTTLRDALTKATAGTGSLKKGMEQVSLATDIARARGTSLAAAQSLVARVQAGGAATLRRLGIDFKVTTDKTAGLSAKLLDLKSRQASATGSQKAALGAQIKVVQAHLAESKALDKSSTSQRALTLLRDRFRNGAKDYGETTAGALDRIKLAFSRIQVGIGTLVLPALGKLAQVGAEALDRLNAKFNEVKPRIQAAFARVGELLQPLIAGVQQVIDKLGGIGTVILAVVAGFVAFKVATIAVEAAGKAWAAFGMVMDIIRNKQLVLNAVMSANPVGLIVIAIAALVAAFVLAYKNIDSFREAVNSALSGVRDAAKKIADYFVTNWLPALKSAWAQIGTVAAVAWGVLQRIVSAGIAVVKTLWSWFGGPMLTVLRGAFDAVVIVIKGAWRIIGDALGIVLDLIHGRWGDAWDKLKDLVKTAFSTVVSVIGTAGKALLSAAGQLGLKLVTGIYNHVKGIPGKVGDFLGKIPGAIVNAAVAIVTEAFNIGKAIVSGIINGFGGLLEAIWNTLKGAVGGAIDKLKGWLGIASPSKRAENEIGVPIADGILRGVRTLGPKLKAAMSTAVRDAIRAAKDNLATLGGNLAGMVGSFLDARLGSSTQAVALRAAQAAKKKSDDAAQIAGYRATIADITKTDEERAAAKLDLDVALAQAAYDVQAGIVDAQKAANDRQISDLDAMLNQGLISWANYKARVQAILQSEGVTTAAIGDELGLAFQTSFVDTLKATFAQAQLIVQAGMAGLRTLPDVVNPATTLRAEVADAKRQLAEDRKAAKDKGGPGGTKITAAEADRIKRDKALIAMLEKLLEAITRPVPVAVTVAGPSAANDSWARA